VAAYPAADPVLEVIRKAEQLKASLDQAAKAGIMLALPSLPSQQQQQQQQQQQEQLLLQLLQGQGYSSLLPALTGANSSSMQLPAGALGPRWAAGGLVSTSAGSQEAVRLLGPPDAAGAGGSNSLLTAGELLAALSGTHGFPAGISQGAAAAAAPAGYLQLPPAQPHSRQRSRRRRIQAAAAGTDSSSSDGESSTSGSSSRSSSSGSHKSSLLAELDGLEELEDLLLQELLNMRAPAAGERHKKDSHHKSAHKAAVTKGSSKAPSAQQSTDRGQPGAPAAATEQLLQRVTAATDERAGVDSSNAQQQQKGGSAGAAAPQLYVELLSLSGLPPYLLPVTAVLKCGSQQQMLDVTALAQQQQQQQDQDSAARTGAGQGLHVTLAGPSTLLQPLLGAQRPCLAVEVWAGQPSTSQVLTDSAAACCVPYVQSDADASTRL
jgi:hypothetical protein